MPPATIFETLAPLAERLDARAFVLGLDLGTKTIGVAVAQVGLGIATPVETLRRRKFSEDKSALLTIASEREAAAWVLGLPLNMDGSEGPRAQSTRAFARNLAAETSIPILLWDERLSTSAAADAMIEAGATRRRRTNAIDAAAAAVILQSALDEWRRRVSS